MAQLTNRQVGELAKQLGHTDISIAKTESGQRWIVCCACGYGSEQSNGRPSVTRATFAEAVRTGQHHLRSSVQAFVQARSRNGLTSTSARQQ